MSSSSDSSIWLTKLKNWKNEFQQSRKILIPVLSNQILTLLGWYYVYDCETDPESPAYYLLDKRRNFTTGNDVYDGALNGAFCITLLALLSFFMLIIAIYNFKKLIQCWLSLSCLLIVFGISSMFLNISPLYFLAAWSAFKIENIIIYKMSSFAAQIKKEKKLVDEKVEKVRQVVPSVSKNDIILALHTYDMDVQRTIQAFCEEGRQGALGDWESTKKPKKPKKKSETSQQQSNTDIRPQNQQNGYKNNGFSGNQVTQPTSSNSSSIKAKQPPKVKQTQNLEKIDRLSGAEKTKVLTSEISTLNVDLNQVQKLFEDELRRAENHIVQCFKEIRQAATERERQLLVALNQVRSDGNSYLTNRKLTLRQLQETDSADKLASEMKTFLSLKQRDLDLGHLSRFVYDNSKLVRSIAQFGDIVSVNGESIQPTPIVSNNQSIKHATSHSSIVSSVGEDSGLGQISPVSNGKHVSVVENNGIAMQSEGLSTDQLAEIQRQVAERLKAQGIDPTVLSTTSSAVAPRRRPQQKEQPKKQAQQPKNNNKKGSQKPIELSILKNK